MSNKKESLTENSENKSVRWVIPLKKETYDQIVLEGKIAKRKPNLQAAWLLEQFVGKKPRNEQ